mmetsp:Transcript_76816/g.134156  ORF Transcript_76816/g.134156 Transcript_76816/m.134156 type:complete len:165 (-) Transcript_76816:93-587(-)
MGDAQSLPTTCTLSKAEGGSATILAQVDSSENRATSPQKRKSEAGVAEPGKRHSSKAGENRRRHSKPEVSSVTQNSNESALNNFKIYFHRRPLRVKEAFEKRQVSGKKVVQEEEFATFLKDVLAYAGDAAEILDELKDTTRGKVTWALIKDMLEHPPWQKSARK